MDYDSVSFKTGIAIALLSKGRQFPHREPVAFLYGHVAKEGETPTHTINGVGYVGVIAPKLPVEWNTDERPYGLIHTYGSTNELRLTTTKIPLGLYDLGGDGNYTLSWEPDWGASPEEFVNDGMNWVSYWYTPPHIEFSSCIWSNYAIKDKIGATGPVGDVYREADIDPIPVYE